MGGQDVELVALGIHEQDTVLGALSHRGSEFDESGRFGRHVGSEEVEMHTVLDGLGFWYGSEEHAHARPGFGFHQDRRVILRIVDAGRGKPGELLVVVRGDG